jgi:prevent-host-death family protein
MDYSSHWPIVQAKAKLAEVIRRSKTAPQVIESDGKPVAVLLPFADFEMIEVIRKQMVKSERQERRKSCLQMLKEQKNNHDELEIPSRKDRPVGEMGDPK